ncbi:hypothetical protein C7271_22570 [filamentous cyanobacterium CCP5]|nr:hypothetical protein C7271_22570 [filamentous cyanobacterium CCP5]
MFEQQVNQGSVGALNGVGKGLLIFDGEGVQPPANIGFNDVNCLLVKDDCKLREAIAQTSMLSPTCKAAIFDIEREIEAHRRTFTNDLSVIDISGGIYIDPPRPFSLYVSLDASDSVARGDVYNQSSALDFLNSPQILTRFTRDITTACGTIGSVTYGLNEYQSRLYGLVDDQVQEFPCYSDNALAPYEPIPWGVRSCP